MTTSSAKTQGALTTAAAAFEDELSRYEQFGKELVGTPINSQKNLQRSKRAMQDCAECEQRLSERLVALLEAMRAAQTRQQRCMDDTLAAAQRIQARVAEFASLMERFAMLGLKARELNLPIAAMMDPKAGGAGDIAGGLSEVVGRIAAIADEADAMAREAEASEWVDIAREADTLKQQVQAARNKVVLAHQKVMANAPS